MEEPIRELDIPVEELIQELTEASDKSRLWAGACAFVQEEDVTLHGREPDTVRTYSGIRVRRLAIHPSESGLCSVCLQGPGLSDDEYQIEEFWTDPIHYFLIPLVAWTASNGSEECWLLSRMRQGSMVRPRFSLLMQESPDGPDRRINLFPGSGKWTELQKGQGSAVQGILSVSGIQPQCKNGTLWWKVRWKQEGQDGSVETGWLPEIDEDGRYLLEPIEPGELVEQRCSEDSHLGRPYHGRIVRADQIPEAIRPQASTMAQAINQGFSPTMLGIPMPRRWFKRTNAHLFRGDYPNSYAMIPFGSQI